MRKNRVRLTEGQLHRVIKESVKKVLREISDFEDAYEFSDRGEIDDDEYDSSVEVSGWVEKMKSSFGVDSNFDSSEDAWSGTFNTEDMQHGYDLTITYNVVGYGEDDCGIECDVEEVNGRSLNNVSEDVKEDIMDFIDSCLGSNDYFELDMMYESTPNFIRFKLIPPM